MTTNDGFLMGSSEIITTQNVIRQEYEGFIIKGEAIISNIVLYNRQLSNEQIKNIDITKQQEWTPDVKLIANMNNTVDGSNVKGLKDSIIKWDIYREEVESENKSIKIGECPSDNVKFVDYKACGGKKYKYYLYPISDTQIGEPLVTPVFQMTINGIFLLDASAIDNASGFNDNKVYFNHFLNTKVKVNDNKGEILIQTDNYLDTKEYDFLKSTNQKILKTENNIYRIMVNRMSYTQKDVEIEFVVCGEV